jgi:hypothetical protein
VGKGESIMEIFTDKYINDEIAKLNNSISDCDSQLMILPSKLSSLINDEARIKTQKQQFQNQWEAMCGPLYSMHREYAIGDSNYSNELDSISDAKSEIENDIKRYNQMKSYYQTEKRKLEILERLSPAERMEKHYQSLINEKKIAKDEKELLELAKKFREMEGYNDTEALAKECEENVLKTKYDRLVQTKNKASTEAEYQEFAKQFREMNGYKDTAELAKECDNQYYVLKENREKQEHVEQDLRKEQERIELERKAAQEKKDNEERECREKQERKFKQRRKIGRIFAVSFAILTIIAYLICEYICFKPSFNEDTFAAIGIFAAPIVILFFTGKYDKLKLPLAISIIFSIILFCVGIFDACNDIERITYIVCGISYTASWVLAVIFRED